MKHSKWGIMLLAGVLSVSGGAMAGTLEDVQSRGELICGVDGGLPGFSAPNDAGKMAGIDADVCYGLAAAVLGDASKVKFVPLTAAERFTSLSSGEIDVLSRNTTHTLTRDASLGINFTYYNFIDGAAFMVKTSLGVKSAKELGGARLCIQAGTTTEQAVGDYFRDNNLAPFTPKPYQTSVQTREGFEQDACDILSSDKSQLAAIRSELSDPSSATVLPETISKEPLGPVVRQGDDVWFNTVKWVLYAMMNAEEMGVSSANVDAMKGGAMMDDMESDTMKDDMESDTMKDDMESDTMKDDMESDTMKDDMESDTMKDDMESDTMKDDMESDAMMDDMKMSTNPGVLRLLGSEGGLCKLLSTQLNDDCFYQVIKQVGNYGEIYENNVGENTPLGLTRAGSPNDLWTRGGLIYAPPLR